MTHRHPASKGYVKVASDEDQKIEFYQKEYRVLVWDTNKREVIAEYRTRRDPPQDPAIG